MYITEKLDGSSCTVYVEDGMLNVCSRNTNWLEERQHLLGGGESLRYMIKQTNSARLHYKARW